MVAGGLFSSLRSSGSECKKTLREVALGYLHTHACLVASESDFHIAIEKRLLPYRLRPDGEYKPLAWTRWKTLVSQILDAHDPDMVHARFHYAELPLSRSRGLMHVLNFGFVSKDAVKPYSYT